MEKKSWFSRFANFTSRWTGHPLTFLSALLIIVIWGITGPLFHFSDTWQLVINTGTTIVTFLMVFLLQSTQNRDSYATQLKLDELIRAVQGAQNSLLNIEEMSEEELEKMKQGYLKMAEKARSIQNQKSGRQKPEAA